MYRTQHSSQSKSELRSLWDAEPLAQFTKFVVTEDFTAISKHLSRENHRLVGGDTIEVYTAMFRKFTRWLRRHHKQISALSPTDINAFVGGEDGVAADLKSSIEAKYLRLLDRCYIYLDITPNPARIAAEKKHLISDVRRDASMVALSPREQKQFIDALPTAAQNRSVGGLPTGWKRRRDRAMQLVMLTGGVRPAEVINLHSDGLEPTPSMDGFHKLTVKSDGKHEPRLIHETLLPDFVAQEVLTWLTERVLLKIPGPLLFPGTLGGARLHPATVYRQVNSTLKRADIEIKRRGGRTLRNTYARNELENGTPITELTRRLGLVLERSTLMYEPNNPTRKKQRSP